MRICRTDAEIVVSAPAKLNLFFEVRAKRLDGFHEIETLMVPVGVFDTLVFRDVTGGSAVSGHVIDFSCQWAAGLMTTAGSSDLEPETLPQGTDNLVVRAIELLRKRANIKRLAQVRLIKRIPSAAGMGGGSSDAAAALLAANMGWDLGWSNEQLNALAAELGSDVPFFLQSLPAVCRGRGEQIEPVVGLASLPVVVVRPPVGLSTAAVYGACQPSVTARSVDPLVEALRQGDYRFLPDLMHNALEPAASGLSVWVARMKYEFAGQDCLATQMSGSGTSYFGICRSSRHAQTVASRLRSRRLGWVFTTTCN